MRERRPRHQCVLELMPGAEPWALVRTSRGHFKLPASCSVLELLEELAGGRRRPSAPTGEIMVRVPLEVALASPTIGEYRRRKVR